MVRVVDVNRRRGVVVSTYNVKLTAAEKRHYIATVKRWRGSRRRAAVVYGVLTGILTTKDLRTHFPRKVK